MAKSTNQQLNHPVTLLPSSEIILPSSDLYLAETSTWAAQRNLHPRLIVQPSSTQSLSEIVAHLATTDLDFAIRGSGYGSASAKDVLISMTSFDDFDFDRESEVLTIGAGLLWREYYDRMENVAPDYHCTHPSTLPFTP